LDDGKCGRLLSFHFLKHQRYPRNQRLKILWISLTADFTDKTDWMMENAEDCHFLKYQRYPRNQRLKILWISLTADFTDKTDWMMENAVD